ASVAAALSFFSSGLRPSEIVRDFPSKVVTLKVLMCGAAAVAAASPMSAVSVNLSAVREARTDEILSAETCFPAGAAADVHGASFFARLATTGGPPSNGI